MNCTPKNCRSKLNLLKKKFSISERGLRFDLKIAKTTTLGVSDRNFFFCGKEVDCSSVSWSEIYRGLLWFHNHSIIISGSQSKVEKTIKNSVFSTFDCDSEINEAWRGFKRTWRIHSLRKNYAGLKEASLKL